MFGSNEAGRHGKGAAQTAHQLFGAVWGVAEGLTGYCYALPTVNATVTGKVPMASLKQYVNNFIQCAKDRQDLTFLVTEVGCGLAGFTVDQVAPLFSECADLDNVFLPKSFAETLIRKGLYQQPPEEPSSTC